MAVGELPEPTRQYYLFDGWFTELGEQVTAESSFARTEDLTLVAHWTLNSFVITLDSNGGQLEEEDSTLRAYCSQEIGTLPVPTRDYYTFAGWFTDVSEGTQVTDANVFYNANDITIYAHWELNPVSDWVKAEDMPEDAAMVDHKWTYTESTTSPSSSLSGWPAYYKSTWVWSDYGSWSGWSRTQYSGSDSRQVESRTVTDQAGYTNYKYYIYRTSDGWGYGTQNYNTGTSHGKCTIYDEINLSYALPVYNSNLGLYGPYNSSKFSHSGDSYWFSGGSWWVNPVTHQEWHYRDRSKIYTYYYMRDDQVSTTEISNGGNISNVQKWVKYRLKNSDSQPTTPEPTANTTTHYVYYHWYSSNYNKYQSYQYDSTYTLHQVTVDNDALTWKSKGSTGTDWYGSYTCPDCGSTDYWIPNYSYQTED